MAHAPKLTATPRVKAQHKLAEERAAGKLPAILYGHKVEPALYWLKYLDFEKLYKSAGESTIIELMTEGKKDANVLIQEVDRDPMSGRFLHVDFYQVRMDEEIETDVPFEFVGESAAVKELSGILVKSLNEVKIKCLPKDLPHALTVDLSALATFEDQIKLKDLKLPHGVTLLEDVETIVVIVDRPRSEAEMAALDEKVEADVTKVEGVVKAEAGKTLFRCSSTIPSSGL